MAGTSSATERQKGCGSMATYGFTKNTPVSFHRSTYCPSSYAPVLHLLPSVPLPGPDSGCQYYN